VPTSSAGQWGIQSLPANFRKVYNLKADAQVLTSDRVLQKEGWAHLMEVMKKKPDAKITILGSQHSAFSVAHMLLEGPYKLRRTFTYTKKRREKRCKRCRTCAHTQRCECAVTCLCYSNPERRRASSRKWRERGR